MHRTHQEQVRKVAEARVLIRQIRVGHTASPRNKHQAHIMRMQATRALVRHLDDRLGKDYRKVLMREAKELNLKLDYEYSLSRRRSQPLERQI